jgi:hypothetical protein
MKERAARNRIENIKSTINIDLNLNSELRQKEQKYY